MTGRRLFLRDDPDGQSPGDGGAHAEVRSGRPISFVMNDPVAGCWRSARRAAKWFATASAAKPAAVARSALPARLPLRSWIGFMGVLITLALRAAWSAGHNPGQARNNAALQQSSNGHRADAIYTLPGLVMSLDFQPVRHTGRTELIAVSGNTE